MSNLKDELVGAYNKVVDKKDSFLQDFNKGELPMDHEPSLNSIAQNYADKYDEDEFTTEDWDYLYEKAWNAIECNLKFEKLEMVEV